MAIEKIIFDAFKDSLFWCRMKTLLHFLLNITNRNRKQLRGPIRNGREANSHLVIQ